ncbi:MAG: bifunctional 4-hydroxy-3-methylbut-2-enyl diphosphate reductase/30S ribosomal protein S1 [Oscillospiraceae bacterium]|jgi:4-hydroxy-3-methylbut-2-enyl diphosphate reductase|nr:bifunctional 4-hydroxy-3-methylbut-2-enyl diphosphate reductase/30S ribosomal protein S1 [Oscillospiraceae bacterium]
MKVIVAESAGFCFGVKRAVELCEDAAGRDGGCLTLGPLIHNRAVTDALREKGAREIADIDEAPEGASVVIRSHGIGKAEYLRLRERKIDIVDATCPFVEKIHDIVESAEADGRTPVIIGEREHAEVIAIAGWCRAPRVFETPEELREWLGSCPEAAEEPVTVVFQTTCRQEIFFEVSEIIKKQCTNQKIFDTICDATNRRQKETRELSRKCDAVIVIGGRESANSRRLAEIAREETERVFFIENADELDTRRFLPGDTIAITAGASTPACIIKEVNQKMFEETEVRADEIAEETPEEVVTDIAEQEPEAVAEEPEAVAEEPEAEEHVETFEELLEKSIKTLHTGEKVTGVVAAVTPTEISVDLGIKQSGYIPIAELTDDPSAKLEDIVKVGEDIEVIVMRVNDVEGTVMLSRRRLDAMRSWTDIEEAMENKTVVEGVVTEENKGGVVVSVRGIRVFVPASRTGLPREAQMAELLKKQVRLIITEVNQPRRRVVGSISAVSNEERRERADKIWNDIEEGKRYTGVVKSLTSYGAFVDIGGIDGMVHVSELSWTHIAKPADVLSVGQEVEVYVISFDREKKKISLGYKDHGENPWVKFTDANNIGDVVTVKIVKLMKFGAFAEIIPGVDGLIHVSQIADHRIAEPSEALSEGDTVDVKITDIDNEKQKVSLSIKALLDTGRRDEPDELVYDTDNPEEPEAEEPEVEEPEVEAPEVEAPEVEAESDEPATDGE